MLQLFSIWQLVNDASNVEISMRCRQAAFETGFSYFQLKITGYLLSKLCNVTVKFQFSSVYLPNLIHNKSYLRSLYGESSMHTVQFNWPIFQFCANRCYLSTAGNGGSAHSHTLHICAFLVLPTDFLQLFQTKQTGSPHRHPSVLIFSFQSDRNIAWNFLRGSARQPSSPFYPSSHPESVLSTLPT